jgi:6-phospho-3-hexuloisomerase
MMRAFAMRLFHLGFDVHVVGDMTTPPVGAGDALIVSAGPGAFSTVLGLMGVAKQANARTIVVTAQPEGAAAKQADAVVHLPAQTMADDQTSQGILPMGTVYEAAQLLFFELIVIQLRERSSQSADNMRERHTNLE